MAKKKASKLSSKKFDQRQTGLLFVIVGLSGIAVGLMVALGHPFWRGATAGVGLASLILGLSYIFPKYLS